MKATKIKNNKVSNRIDKLIQENDKRRTDKYQRHRNKSTKTK